MSKTQACLFDALINALFAAALIAGADLRITLIALFVAMTFGELVKAFAAWLTALITGESHG